MENWIGVAIWIVLGSLIALSMKAIVPRPEATSGHTTVLVILGAFAALVGGMLGVGLFAFQDPKSLSVAGMGGAAVLSALFAFVYRWGIRGLI